MDDYDSVCRALRNDGVHSVRLSSRRSSFFRALVLGILSAFDVAEWNPYGLIAEVHDTFLVVDRFVQRIGRFIRKEIRLRLGPTKRLITDVCGWTFLKISDIVVFRYIAGTVILALELGYPMSFPQNTQCRPGTPPIRMDYRALFVLSAASLP